MPLRRPPPQGPIGATTQPYDIAVTGTVIMTVTELAGRKRMDTDVGGLLALYAHAVSEFFACSVHSMPEGCWSGADVSATFLHPLGT